MLYTGTFTDPHQAITDIISHATSLGISVVSVTVDQNSILAVETVGQFPADQLDHLGIAEVA